MAYIPTGEFTMGSEVREKNEMPIHTVYLDGYWMDQTPVTNAMYLLCMNAGQCETPTNGYYTYSAFADYPVVFVSWDKANAYCEWTDSHLPTEAEWEKAARGTDQRSFPWGEGFDCSKANYDSCVGSTTIVNRYESGKSPYGLYDMAGNVWEWTADWYDENYYANTPLSNPLGAATGDFRVLRGGAWGFVNFDMRTSYRYKKLPETSTNNIGFRCVRNALDETAP